MAFNLIKGLMNSEATSKILLPIEIQQKALMEKTKAERLSSGLEDEEEMDENAFISKLSPEARARMKASDKMTTEVITFAKENPDQATSLMRAWLTQKG